MTVTNDLGCSAVEEVGVLVNAIEVPVIEGETTICEGEKTVLTVLGDYESYLWSDGSTTSSIEAEQSTYSVTVLDANTCDASTSIVVESVENPIAEILGSKTFCEGNSTILDIEENFASFLWSNGCDNFDY